jgi:holliday junction DNA helicase RuvA
MIGRINGVLLEKQPPHLLVDVSGVAYEVQASMQTFYQLPEIGQRVTLHTHFVVREDAQQLFGFIVLQERALFRTLLKVNGIGAKSALAILSSIAPDDFVRCISVQDIQALQRVPGIGKKTAERLIIEMRDRLADWETSGINVSTEFANGAVEIRPTSKQVEQEALSALLALGFKPQEASRLITKVAADNLSCEELIRLALQGVAQ